MSAQKRKGTAWESAIVAFLQAQGFRYAERRALTGALDKGDITGIPGVVIEAKNVARTDLSGWLDEAEQERANAGAQHGAVWFKRRGHTSPGRAYVLMTGDRFVELLREAGYGGGQ